MRTAIGPYELVRLIEAGGQGRVFLGYDTRLQRQVAIKIVRLPEGRAARKRAMTEARLVAGLLDERIVKIYDVIESPQYLALVMEYVPGTDLERVLGAVRLSAGSILRVASDLAAALAVARQVGVVHGDIKAANVLVTAEGHTRLADFGVARAQRANPGNVPGGSVEALAPEQIDGGPIDTRTDLFALGRLLHRMLTGQHAFPNVLREARHALLASEYPLPALDALADDPGYPPALLDLVRQLLQREPDQRLQDIHQLRRTLRALRLEHSQVGANELLRQAKPVFRVECADDLPLEVPAQLQLSAVRQRRGTAIRDAFRALVPGSLHGRIAVTAVTVLLCAGFAWWARPDIATVELDVSEVKVSPAAAAGLQLTDADISRLVTREIESRVPGVRVAGAARPSVVYSDTDATANNTEVLALNLQCADMFCLLALERRQPARDTRAQRLLPADASRDHWQDEIGDLVAAIYTGD